MKLNLGCQCGGYLINRSRDQSRRGRGSSELRYIVNRNYMQAGKTQDEFPPKWLLTQLEKPPPPSPLPRLGRRRSRLS